MTELFDLTRMRTVSILRYVCRKKVVHKNGRTSTREFLLADGGLSLLSFKKIKYHTQEALESVRSLPLSLKFCIPSYNFLNLSILI